MKEGEPEERGPEEITERIMSLFSKGKRFVLYCVECDDKLGEDLPGHAETTNQTILNARGVDHVQRTQHDIKLIRKIRSNGD